MNQEPSEEQIPSWAEEHPWLSRLTSAEEEDAVGETVRYALDELRLA